jgi:uncharacterized protein
MKRHAQCGFTLVELLTAVAIILILFTWLATTTTSCRAATAPVLRGPVNDDAKILTSAQVESLKSTLLGQEKETGNQIVILTIPTLDGRDIGQFALETAISWKLGKNGKDNGVLFVAAVKEHKTWLSVGRGLEGMLTDAVCRRILDQQVKPQFRAGDYYAGIQAAVASIDAKIHGKVEPAPVAPKAAATTFWHTTVGIIIIVILVIVLIIILVALGGGGCGGGFGSSGGSSSSSWGGGGGGGYSGGGGDFGGGGAGGGW